MLPHREWNNLDLVTLLRSSDDNSDTDITKWTTEHLLFANGKSAKMGNYTPAALVYQAWHPIFKPKSADFALLAGLDECVDYGFWYTISLLSNEAGETSGMLFPFVLHDANQARYELVNGKYYDGINPWSAYPPGTGHNYFDQPTITIASLPLSDVNWVQASEPFPRGNDDQESFFMNGVYLRMANWIGGSAEPFPIGESCALWIEIQKIRANYLNPVVNSLSRRTMPVTGGVSLVLTGLGFDQADAELNSTSRNPNNANGAAWNSLVDFIDFIGQQGQSTMTLDRTAGDFTVDSDSQITIPSMPALAYGTYYIQLRKQDVTPEGGIDVSAYAGDWSCNVNGYCTAGVRTSLFAGEGDERPPREGSPIILTDWQLKDKLDLSFVDKSYAPKDVCCTAKFYDGRLQEVSGLQRAVNDITGVFISSDMTAKLVNVDKEFSKLLAQYYFKNEPIEMYLAFKDYPESWKTQFFRGFVEDHSLEGGEFDVSIRDLTTVFFQRKVPFYRITREEYPLAHDSAIARPMQEAIGQLSYIAAEASGAMEAFLIDTSAFRYLAARGSLKAITQVYNDGELVDPAQYAIVYADGGRTYIDFTVDQGESKITYNCEGYMYDDWNSVNGYVQHPVYVFLFYLMLIIGAPINYIDFDSFEAVKDILDNLDPAIATSGYLGLMEEQDAMSVNQELCQTIGGSLFPDRFGRLKLAMKDISKYHNF